MLFAIYIENTHPNEDLNIPFGGIQAQLLELLPAYKKIKNLRISLITRYSECQSTSKDFKIYQIHKFRGSFLDKLYFYLGSFYKMVKIHKVEHINIINVHTFSYNIIIPLILRLIFKIPILMKMPIDFRSHIKEVSLMKRYHLVKKFVCYSWLNLFQKYLIKKINFIRVINKRMFEEITDLNYSKRRILRIPNGIEFLKYIDLDKIEHKDVNFGFIGRLSQFKNLKYMLMEFKDYFEEFPSDKLYIYGMGSELSYIKAFIEENDLSDNIFILGFERDRKKIYSSIDVLIDPSLGQGISNANLEAMSTNTFLIASEVDGNIDLVRDGETGLLFNPRKKGALLEKLIFYKKYPRQVNIIIENARKKISETHNISSIINQILDFVFNKSANIPNGFI
ncbi:MAG: glycosyltransferase family 4 protein [Promethearchaeota archaeon]